jgi:hypothetical protein
MGRTRYRYYVARALHHGAAPAGQGLRLPAREIEQVVMDAAAAQFDDPLALAERASLAITSDALPQLSRRCAGIALAMRQRTPSVIAQLLAQLLAQVRVLPERIEIGIRVAGLAEALMLPIPLDTTEIVTLAVPVRLTRTGRAIRLVQDNGAAAAGATDDASLIKLIARARQWWDLLCTTGIEIKVLAAREGVTASWMTRVVRLAFLSPAVIDAALAGKLRAGINAIDLMDAGAISGDWQVQAAAFLPAS